MYIYANRYERIAGLGAGATGRVVLVRDIKTGMPCALKIFHSDKSSSPQKLIENFQREFDILKNLNHISVARVYDAGLHEDPVNKRRLFYMATEYIDGKNLFEATMDFSMAAIEDLFIQTLRALNYLHSQGIFHFDIKPQNLLVTIRRPDNAKLKIIDFGMANIFSDYPFNQDFLAGTVAYMAPEIIRGLSYDGRSDLYSLGCTFYQVLTRQLPFRGEVEEVKQKHLEEKPESIPKLNDQVPEYLENIVSKLLEKNPTDRYATPQQVLEDLGLLTGRSILIETPETITSYLPEKGDLVGREKEKKLFDQIYKDRIVSKKFTMKPWLLVCGTDHGLGKTRFLEFCKNRAQKDFVKILSWTESGKMAASELPQPCLILGDDVPVDSQDLEYLELFFENQAVLAVISIIGASVAPSGGLAAGASPSPPLCGLPPLAELDVGVSPSGGLAAGASPSPPRSVAGSGVHTIDLNVPPAHTENSCVVCLHPFNRNETIEYLKKATGISSFPEKIINTLYQRTNGNPLYLTEYVRFLFERGFFKDEQGGWSETILDDLGQDLERMGSVEYIKQKLGEKLLSCHLDEPSKKFLHLLALTGKPTIEDLVEMTDAASIEDKLQNLIQKGILKFNAESQYDFSNPLLKEIVFENMPDELKEKYCDQIADYHEGIGSHKDIILYYRGRGGLPQAQDCLMELAGRKKAMALYHEAKDNLLELLSKKTISPDLSSRGLLEIAEIGNELGQYDQAKKWLSQLLSGYPDKTNLKKDQLVIVVRALEQLGKSHYRNGELQAAMQYYQQGLEVLSNNKSPKWLEVMLKNCLARIELDRGNLDQAEQSFLQTWNIWKNELDEQGRIKGGQNDIDLVYYQKSEFKKAIPFLIELLGFYEQFAYLDQYPITLYKLGRVYLGDGKSQKGKEILENCLEILKQRHMPQWLFAVYNELGNVHEASTETNLALSYYQHSFDLAKKTALGDHLYSTALNLGRTHLKLAQTHEARKYYLFVVKHHQHQKDLQPSSARQLFMGLLGLVEVYNQQGKYPEACGFLEEMHQLLTINQHLNTYRPYYLQAKKELDQAKVS